VLLHGRAADEHDLTPLLDLLDPNRRLVGLLPRGPLALPPGGAHWYVVRRVGYPDPGTFLPTYERAGSWLDEALVDAGVPTARTVLGGFSQGAVIAYALGLGAGRPRPAAIVAMSGFLPRVEGFELDLESRAGLPVAVSHGTYDPIIDVSFGQEAKGLLEGAGLDVTYREDPVAHQISPAALAQARAVLERALGS
jgi:phospholipase/carboxylesterase